MTIDVKYAIKKLGESQNLVCTGDGDASMTIAWFAADAPETALTAVLGDFDNKAGTFTIYCLSVILSIILVFSAKMQTIV